jgi:hypothetical protein
MFMSTMRWADWSELSSGLQMAVIVRRKVTNTILMAARRKRFTLTVAHQRPNTQYAWGAEGTDSCYSAPATATLTTLYNEREQPTHLLFYDATDRLLSRVEFSYDANANLIQEAQTNTVDTLPPEMLTTMNPAQLETVRAMLGAAGEPVRRMHRYDGNGRRIETRTRMGLLGGDIKTMV